MFRTFLPSTLVALVALSSGSIQAASQDLSTPKKAAVEFAKGLETGDLAGARSASVGSNQDFKIVEVISGLIRSARELRSAAMEKFGDAGKQVVPNGDELADFSRRVDAGTEKITGDTATVGQADEHDPMKLKKDTEGSWHVDLASIPEKEELSRMMPRIQKVLSSATSDIKAGKYKTADEAKDAIGQQMFSVIAEPVATQPAAPAPPTPPAAPDKK